MKTYTICLLVMRICIGTKSLMVKASVSHNLLLPKQIKYFTHTVIVCLLFMHICIGTKSLIVKASMSGAGH